MPRVRSVREAAAGAPRSRDDRRGDDLAHIFTPAIYPDPDLLIRTSGELRLSNFLLWQLSYTEIVVTHKLWPDFGKEDLRAAIAEFNKRQRRFGGL